MLEILLSFALNQEVLSSCTSASGKLEFRVTVCKVDKEYLYIYKLKNVGPRSFRVSSEIVNRACGSELWWKLKPGEEKVIRLKSKEAPFWVKGSVSVVRFGRLSLNNLELPPGNFGFTGTFITSGALPKCLIKHKP